MRTYDNLCAITESSNLTFPMTRLAVSTFIANNLWFDGTVIIATIKNNGLNQSNIDILKSIYEKVEILEIDHKDPIMQGVASKLLKKNIPSDRVLDYLNILAFNIKSEGNIYFSRNTVFMGDVSDMLDSNHLVAPTNSNNFPILDDFSDSSINSKLMFVPKYLISNSNYSIILERLSSLNISDSHSDNYPVNDLIKTNSINTRIVSNLFMCKSSNFIDQKYSNFIRYSKSIKSIHYNTHDSRKNYLRIHTYWLQQNDSIQRRLNDIKKNNKLVSIKLEKSVNPLPPSVQAPTALNISNFRIKDAELKKNKVSKNLNIALCTICNDGFVDGARVMINSFLRHNSWFSGKMIVYYNTVYSPLSESSMNLIKSLYKDTDFVNVDHTIYDDLIKNFIKGNKSQQRLVPSLFTFEVFNDIGEFDKILYLDSDMVVLDDISEIFGLNYDLVVTPDAGEYIDKVYGTFNGGFLLLNNSIFKKEYREGLIRHAEGMKNMFLADQTIMNSFFSEGLPMLSLNYNCLKRCFSDSKYNKNVEKVKIIHYVGEKPWSTNKSQMEQKYSQIEKIWFDELNLIQPNKKIGVFIHLYYTDLWEEISTELKKINMPFDLHVSLCRDNIDISDKIISEYPNSYIVKVKNAGADFGGFFESLNNSFDLNLKYDWILKIHSKKSKLINEKSGETWRKNLYKSLMGEFKSKVVNHLKDSEAGMIGPKNQVMSTSSFDKKAGTNVNSKNIDLFRKKFNIKDNQLKFFKGSMFWISYPILEGTFKNNRITVDFFEDGHAPDGTLAHAMERFISNVVRDSGKKIIEI